ncbi:hypothetical protein CGCTS75_v003956 [Colletotrichum tropicale]|nr:hypothetical protein CGCTS75_v003956 [Colletotrichum tropicale]
MTDADNIDWKEAFCWFFWDICARDEDESYEPGTYNDFVSDFISRERLPINTIDHPRSWDHLLWHLMRATVYDRGKSRFRTIGGREIPLARTLTVAEAETFRELDGLQ